MTEESTAAAAEAPATDPQFAIQRIYLKDLSFETPQGPSVFTKQWQPKVNVDLNTKSDKIDDQGNFEVVLTITITAKIEEETALLLCQDINSNSRKYDMSDSVSDYVSVLV